VSGRREQLPRGLKPAARAGGATTRRLRRAVRTLLPWWAVVPTLLVGCGERPLTENGVIGCFGESGFGPGEFSYPRAVEVAADGRVFVVDKTARIQQFAPDGELVAWFRMPERQAGKPTGMAFDGQGNLLVADTHYSRVLVFDREGKEVTRFGSNGTGDGQFLLPTDVAVDKEGNVFVGEYGGNDRISRFTPDYRFVLSFAGEASGDAALARPSSMVFDGEQTLWVADTVHHRICRFDRDGTLLAQFGTMGGAPGQLRYPRGLSVCPDGTLLVTEYGNNRLQWFDTQGRSLRIWGGPGRALGQLKMPWAATTASDGRVYVVDSGNNRVQILKL